MIICIFATIPITTYAGVTWSDQRTIVINKDSGWKRKTTSNDMAKDEKETNSDYFYVTTKKLTMYNNPQFRMVSRSNTVVSEEIKTGNKNSTKYGINKGLPGTTYYASIKANPLQSGTDSYTFTFSAE